MAQGILSGLQPAELKEAIVQGNLAALTAISGVGRKTAERIVMELRHTLGKIELDQPAVAQTGAQMKARVEAVVALMSLGYSRSTAEQAVRSATTPSPSKELSIEDLIRLALQHATKP